MKRFTYAAVVFCATLLLNANGYAQSLKDFFSNSETKTVYLGIDFSKAKLINDPGANTMDIRNRLYNSINDVTVNEAKKYDFGKAFHKSSVSSDLSAVKKHINGINAENILSSNTDDFNRFSEADISGIVKSLDLSKTKEGVGILFVVEAMKKQEKNDMAAVWVVLINLSNKKVLMTKRYEEKARGFGFRNLWVSPIKGAMDQFDKDYSDFKKQYAKD
jgi:hypothetical protein